MTAEQMKKRIESSIPGAQASVETDGHHYEAIVVATAFEGMPRVKQHRLVYDCLKEEMKQAVHALALKTYTPDAWAKAQGA
jgi:acid stress-induced BolA-like protein IbaG/YrbA